MSNSEFRIVDCPRCGASNSSVLEYVDGNQKVKIYGCSADCDLSKVTTRLQSSLKSFA